MRVTRYGTVLADVTGGRVVGLMGDDRIARFRGVPYASAPFGKNRFLAPQDLTPWDGERDATVTGASTYQIEALFRGSAFHYRSIMSPGWVPGDETLNLNVWTPGGPGDQLPVLVYIHGGAFLTGHGGLPAYDGGALARRGAVVVTINYRTGAEGFLDVPGAATNRGIRDQMAALRWVRANVDEFGGDPGNVTVFGESAGGMSIALLLTSPYADDLFDRAIIESGAGPEAMTAQAARSLGEATAAAIGLPCSLDALQALDPRALLEAALAAPRQHAGRWDMLVTAPWIDDDVVPNDPMGSLLHRPVRPTVWGTNRDEGNLFLATPDVMATTTWAEVDDALRSTHPDPEPVKSLLHERARIDEPGMVLAQHLTWSVFTGSTMTAVDLLASAGRPTWLYRYDYASQALDGRAMSGHTLEMPFVWDHLDSPAHRQMVGPGAPQSLADEMAGSWVRFARSADPGWPAFEPQQRVAHVFDRTSSDVPRLDQDLWQAWTGH